MKLSLLLRTRVLNVLIGCLMAGALLGACGGGGDNSNMAGNTNRASSNAANTASAGNTNAATTSSTNALPSADKIGVAECDEYIAKFEACVNSKVPEAIRATYKSAFDAQRKAWRDAAATPQGRAGMAQGCRAALDTAKQTLASYGCSW